MARILLFLIFCITIISATGALAEDIVVVVNQKNGVNKLSKDEVIDIFLGRNRQLSSGVTALPLDLPGVSPERDAFYSRLTGKSMSEINAYWARLIFSGRASPPTQVRSQEESMQMVIDNRSAIGYLERSKVSSQVKVVYELGAK
jgi:ABC-type phosphate transport system substrate-binding protein